MLFTVDPCPYPFLKLGGNPCFLKQESIVWPPLPQKLQVFPPCYPLTYFPFTNFSLLMLKFTFPALSVELFLTNRDRLTHKLPFLLHNQREYSIDERQRIRQ